MHFITDIYFFFFYKKLGLYIYIYVFYSNDIAPPFPGPKWAEKLLKMYNVHSVHSKILKEEQVYYY